VLAPTLLIVGGLDDVVIELNQAAYNALHCEKRLAIVPDATHLFEEPGTLEEVAELATACSCCIFRSRNNVGNNAHSISSVVLAPIIFDRNISCQLIFVLLIPSYAMRSRRPHTS